MSILALVSIRALAASLCPLPATRPIPVTLATLASDRPAILGANFARRLMSSTATGKAPISCAALAAASLPLRTSSRVMSVRRHADGNWYTRRTALPQARINSPA